MTSQYRRTSRRRTTFRGRRKTKLWCTDLGTEALTGTLAGGNTSWIAGDLLSSSLVSMGFTVPFGWTVMRIIGELDLNENSDASTPAWASVAFGIAWLNSDIVALDPDDPGIPDPRVGTASEARWITTGILSGMEPSSTVIGKPLDPIDTSRIMLDTRQMRKQPFANAKLALVARTYNTLESNTVALTWNLKLLMALP